MPRLISSVIIAAMIVNASVLVLAQRGAKAGSAAAGMGTGASSANAGPSALSGTGTGAGMGASTASAGASAPPGMGTKDTGVPLHSNNQPTNPNVQSPTKSRTAAQAARNVGAGHANNGLPIGAVGTGTSNEDQMITGPASNRNGSAAQAEGNAGATPGRGSLSDQVSRLRPARAGDKVLDAKAQVKRRTTVSHKHVPGPVNGDL